MVLNLQAPPVFFDVRGWVALGLTLSLVVKHSICGRWLVALIYLHLCRWVLNPASIICWCLTLCLCYSIALLTVAYICSIWPCALLLLGDLRQLALLAEWIGPSNNRLVVLLSSSVNRLCLELHFLLLAQSYLPT